tara:strand:+ start:823 stop:1806 length:984 start_codon:yes stop_codon:yes gene_type:complete
MKSLVLGAGGFIGNHMVNKLKSENYYVVAVDLKRPEFSETMADEFYELDLTVDSNVYSLFGENNFEEIYQYAADMGGAGYIFTGDNDADVMYNSAKINLNVLNAINKFQEPKNTKIFYSSSACIYPEEIQMDNKDISLKEHFAYPANPDSEYGWEKLFSERLFLSFHKNYGLNVKVARFHNIYGPLGTWTGGKEKAPAAICRKVSEASSANNFEVEIWGDGLQTRSFLYIDDCIEATRRFMNSDFNGPINIGSEEMVSINDLAEMVAEISDKDISLKHIEGPLGVRGRNSNNDLIRETLQWDYQFTLREGITRTYNWIDEQVSLLKN